MYFHYRHYGPNRADVYLEVKLLFFRSQAYALYFVYALNLNPDVFNGYIVLKSLVIKVFTGLTFE